MTRTFSLLNVVNNCLLCSESSVVSKNKKKGGAVSCYTFFLERWEGLTVNQYKKYEVVSSYGLYCFCYRSVEPNVCHGRRKKKKEVIFYFSGGGCSRCMTAVNLGKPYPSGLLHKSPLTCTFINLFITYATLPHKNDRGIDLSDLNILRQNELTIVYRNLVSL